MDATERKGRCRQKLAVFTGLCAFVFFGGWGVWHVEKVEICVFVAKLSRKTSHEQAVQKWVYSRVGDQFLCELASEKYPLGTPAAEVIAKQPPRSTTDLDEFTLFHYDQSPRAIGITWLVFKHGYLAAAVVESFTGTPDCRFCDSLSPAEWSLLHGRFHAKISAERNARRHSLMAAASSLAYLDLQTMPKPAPEN